MSFILCYDINTKQVSNLSENENKIEEVLESFIVNKLQSKLVEKESSKQGYYIESVNDFFLIYKKDLIVTKGYIQNNIKTNSFLQYIIKCSDTFNEKVDVEIDVINYMLESELSMNLEPNPKLEQGYRYNKLLENYAIENIDSIINKKHNILQELIKNGYMLSKKEMMEKIKLNQTKSNKTVIFFLEYYKDDHEEMINCSIENRNNKIAKLLLKETEETRLIKSYIKKCLMFNSSVIFSFIIKEILENFSDNQVYDILCYTVYLTAETPRRIFIKILLENYNFNTQIMKDIALILCSKQKYMIINDMLLKKYFFNDCKFIDKMILEVNKTIDCCLKNKLIKRLNDYKTNETYKKLLSK